MAPTDAPIRVLRQVVWGKNEKGGLGDNRKRRGGAACFGTNVDALTN